MYWRFGGAWEADVMKVLLGAAAVEKTPSPTVARQTARAQHEGPIDRTVG